MKKNNAIEVVKKHDIGCFKVITNNNKVFHKRLFYQNYSIYEIDKGKRKWGHQVSDYDIDTWKEIEYLQVSDLEIVKKFLTKVVKYLSISGLWNNIKEDYTTLLNKGDNFISDVIESSYNDRKKLLDSIGISLHCDDLLTTAKKGIVSINYNSWEKDTIRNLFKNNILQEKEYSYSWRKGYDNSVYCHKINDIMCAWYSTEYINCGNGHYYLAIDERHAFFCEND